MGIDFLIRIIAHGISGFYFYRLINCFLPVKNNKYIKAITLLIMFYIPNVIIYNSDLINISFTMIGFIGVMLFCFEGKPIEKISIVMILYPTVVALNFMTRELAAQLHFAFNQNTFIEYVIKPIIKGTVCVAWFVIYQVFKNRLQKPYLFIDIKSWLLIDTVCLAPLISIISAIINTPFGKQDQIYLTAFACIITSLGMLLLIEYIVKSVKVGMENHNLKLEAGYYKELERNQLEIRKLRHDMNHHLCIINSFLNCENLQDAKNYFNSLSDQFQVSNREFCHNSIVNAVINVKYNLAIQNEIDCFFHIDMNGLIPIDDIDLCSIFANTLDNAIEASQKIDDPSKRKIVLKARCDKGYFSYNIINTIGEEITVSQDRYLTTKQDKETHGYGIEIIKGIVEKYNGILEINPTSNEFSILIAIKIE
jgi:hypothetical protein